MPVLAIPAKPVRTDASVVNAEQVRQASGRQIEVLFGDEDRGLVVDLRERTKDDDVAAALVDCLGAPSADEAEGRLNAGLDGLDGTVRRAP